MKLEQDLQQNKQIYYDKVYACWMGKNIGGTLGVPFEGNTALNNLQYYSEVPTKPLENDDLDLQLVWLHALEQYGPGVTSRELAQEWLDHIFFPFDEYGYCLTNLRLGLLPPFSSFGNPFIDCMGSPIRSEIWACVCPGNPEAAVYYAYQDAIVDHAGGEGVYAEMFVTAMQSAAFCINDPVKIIQIGLQYIPEECRTAKAVCSVLDWHSKGLTWQESRHNVIETYGNTNFTDAPQNIAFTIIGFLYGKDFGDSICIAVNCGYDTDCTGATLGALLGIIGGRESIPISWSKPLGESIVVSKEVNGFIAPKDLCELTERVCTMSERVSSWVNTNLQEIEIELLWATKIQTQVMKLPSRSEIDNFLDIEVDYGIDGPTIQLGSTRNLKIKIQNKSNVTWNGNFSLKLPYGWTGPEPIVLFLESGHTKVISVTISSSETWNSSYEIEMQFIRNLNQSIWSSQKCSFVLVPKRRWVVQHNFKNNELYSTDNRVPFPVVANVDQKHIAETSLFNPIDQPIRLIVATTSKLVVSLDGNLVIMGEQSPLFIPAYHRPRIGNYVELILSKGEHLLKIEIEPSKEELVPETRMMIVHQKDGLFANINEIQIG